MGKNKEQGVVGNNGGEISGIGKLLAGILFIFFTSAAILVLVAYWPDRLPKPGDKYTRYENRWFNMSLIDSSRLASLCPNDTTNKNLSAQTNTDNGIKEDNPTCISLIMKDSININTLLLILVAVAGFLGNMIHIASSFTNFVGSNKFERSWTLWYWVKPFTAAGLAVLIYFMFRAGFLNFSEDSGNINLYGIIILAGLAGLFTDKATLKLEEIFGIIFKTKDERPGKLVDDEFIVTSISPEVIPQTGESLITLIGQNLDRPDIKITIDGIVVDAIKTPEKIGIKYTPTDTAIAAGKVVLLIADREEKNLYPAKEIKIGLPNTINELANNENFPNDTGIGDSNEYHDESKIGNTPPTDPPPNIK